MITGAMPHYTGAEFFEIKPEPFDRMVVEYAPIDTSTWRRSSMRGSNPNAIGVDTTIAIRSSFKALGIDPPSVRAELPRYNTSSGMMTNVGVDFAVVAGLLEAAGIVNLPGGHVVYGRMKDDRIMHTRGIIAVVRSLKPGMVLHTSIDSVPVVERNIPDGVIVYGYRTIEDFVCNLGVRVDPKPWQRPVMSRPNLKSFPIDDLTVYHLAVMAVGDHPGVVTRCAGRWDINANRAWLIDLARYCRSLTAADEQLVEADIIRDIASGTQTLGPARPQPMSSPRDDCTAERIEGTPCHKNGMGAFGMYRFPEPTHAHGGVLLIEDICGSKPTGIEAIARAWNARSCRGWPTNFMMLGFELSPKGETAEEQYVSIVESIEGAGRDASFLDPHSNRAARVGFHVELAPNFDATPTMTDDELREAIERGVETRKARGQVEPNGRLTGAQMEKVIGGTKGLPDGCEWVFSAPFDNVDVRVRLFRVARTIADMDGSADVRKFDLIAARAMTFIRPSMSWRQ